MAYWVNPICPPDSALCLAGPGGVADAVGDVSATVGTPQGLGTLGAAAAAADSEVSLFLLLIFSLIGLDAAAGVLRMLLLEHGTGDDRASGGVVAEEADDVARSFVSLSFVVVEFMLRSFG